MITGFKPRPCSDSECFYFVLFTATRKKTYSSIVKEKYVYERQENLKKREVFESNGHLITHKAASSSLETVSKVTKTDQTITKSKNVNPVKSGYKKI